MKSISLSDTNKLQKLASKSESYIMKALPERGLGVILADQDTGKSRLMFSLAYSLATNIDLVGLLPEAKNDRKPRKVAVWAAEEGINWAAKKALAHLSAFSVDIAAQIQENVTFIDDTSPDDEQEYLFTSSGLPNHRFVAHLTNALKDVDILFIDTLREAMGLGDEVADDNQLKVMLSGIAKEAQCAIVFLHHLRKADTGLSSSKLTTASGSGLSKTNAKARVHYALTRNNKTKGINISFVKANNISLDERLDIPLNWMEMKDHSILLSHDNLNELSDILINGSASELTSSVEREVQQDVGANPEMEAGMAECDNTTPHNNVDETAHNTEELSMKKSAHSQPQKPKKTVDVPERVVHKIQRSTHTPSNVSKRVRSLRGKAKASVAGSNPDQD